MAKKRIIIDIDDEQKTIQVTQEVDGAINQRYLLESLALFGGDAKNKELFIKMFGASSDAAWAYGQGFRIAHSEGADPALKNFYVQSAAHVCQIIDPDAFQNEVGAEEVLNKWDCQDQTKWGGWDTEDVLADKERSEARRKAEARMTAPDEPPTDPKKFN